MYLISIHAPRVGGDDLHPALLNSTEISIHAPRVGGDEYALQQYISSYEFQSTPPVWGATGCKGHIVEDDSISIHAPRVGGDHISRLGWAWSSSFQSTPPVWGATETERGKAWC